MAGHVIPKEEGVMMFFLSPPHLFAPSIFNQQIGLYGRWPAAHSTHAFVTCEPRASPLVIMDFPFGTSPFPKAKSR
ncbi:hypothetical protein BT93_I1078 [Corymbia citriodora subsp. variegata]|nr:hypothetical protein BT93_I1078 [Corymbia citriodora subsp. variegata]